MQHVAIDARAAPLIAGAVERVEILKREQRQRERRWRQCALGAATMIAVAGVVPAGEMRQELAHHRRLGLPRRTPLEKARPVAEQVEAVLPLP